jgi:hypothetical protein
MCLVGGAYVEDHDVTLVNSNHNINAEGLNIWLILLN